MEVKPKMESTTEALAGNKLDEKVNAIVDNVGQHLALEKIETNGNLSNVDAKIEEALKLIRKENQKRDEIDTMLTERKWDLEYSMPKLKYMRYFSRYGYQNSPIEVQKLQQALHNCHVSHSIINKDANVKKLYHQLYKCSNLKEERRILKEMQQVEEENRICEDEMENILQWEWSYWGLGTPTNSKEVLRKRIEEAFKELQLSSELDRKRIAEEEKLKKEIEQVKNDIRLHRTKLEQINKNKATLYGHILLLKKQLDKNFHFQATINYN